MRCALPVSGRLQREVSPCRPAWFGLCGLVLAIPFAMLLGLALERLFMGRALLTFLDEMARLPGPTRSR